MKRRREPDTTIQAPRAPSPRAIAVLVTLMSVHTALYGFIAFIKFRYYLYIDIDLPIFIQATDQALRGSLFSSIRGMYWLGDHASLVLFLIAPIYALLRHPMTLLVIQSLTLAVGAMPVFALARRELHHDGVALAFAALYLLYPAVGYSNLFQFHPEVLATTTLLATFWAMAAGRHALALVFATLSLLCKEDVALLVLMLGLTSLLPGRPRRLAGPLVALAVASLVVSFAVIRPALSSPAADYGRMYREWGANAGEVALNLIRDPLRAISAFYDTPGNPTDTLLKRWYWLHMLAPLLFLPLLSPFTLLTALPILAEHFLSYRKEQHWIVFQYTALVTPVMLAAAVHGLRNLLRLVPHAAVEDGIRGRAHALAIGTAAAALAASLVCNLSYGPLLRQGWIHLPTTTEENWPNDFDRTQRVYRDRMVSRIPADAGVVAAFEFLAHVASRRTVHSIHHVYTGHYTFSTMPYPVPTDIGAMIVNIGDPRLTVYVKPGTPLRLRDLVDRNRLRPVDAAGDLVLFLREPPDTVELLRAGAPPPPVARRVVYDGQLAFTGWALPESTVAVGGLLPIEIYWRRVAPADRHFLIQFVLKDASGTAVFSLGRYLGYLLYPVAEWPADTTVRETYRLVIPTHVGPGAYTLGMRVAWRRDAPAQLSTPDDPGVIANDLLVDLGGFTVVTLRRRRGTP